MATMELDSRSSYSDLGYTRRPPLFSAIRWSAIIAGVAVGVSVQLLLSVLGIATGLSATEVSEGETFGGGPLLWAGLSMLIAAFVGAYVAARMSGLKRKADGLLHGLVSWAVTTLLFAAMAMSAGSAALSGIFNNLSMAAGGASQTGQSAGSSPIMSLLRSQIGGNVDAASLQTLLQHIQAGRRDQAVQFMSGSMGVDQTRAAGIVDQALILSGSPQQASTQGRASAERAMQTAGAAAWTVFGAAALSLLFGIGGGVMGAAGARRVTWTESSKVVDRKTSDHRNA